jgi:putative transposase
METHRKKLKRGHEPGHFHELTFSCYRRKPLLTNDTWRQELARRIDLACIEADFDLNAFVFMPEHVHLLIFPRQKDPDIGKFLARFKQPFSRYVKEMLVANHARLLADLTIRERPGKTCFRFWQEGAGFDRNLFTPEVIEASINYIHLNPVKRSLCLQAIQWKWSSAKYYFTGILDDGLPRITAPSDDLFEPGGLQFSNY